MKLKLAAVLLLCAGAASAQLYKWKDAKGVTHYTDTPPAATAAAKAELKSFPSGGPALPLPPELAAAVKARPVTLYSKAGCDICISARAMLQARGIPFSEKTVNSEADHAALKLAGSNGELPLLLIGRGKQVGFEKVTWDEALTEAGYPAQRMLPANYQYPAATAAAPRQAAANAPPKQDEAARRLPPVNAPSNFQF